MRKIQLFISVIILGLILTSCTKKNDGGGIDNKDMVEDKFNISIAIKDEDGEMEVMKALVAAYEKENPDVHIVIKDFGGDSTSTAYITRYAQSPEKLPMMMWTTDAEFSEPAEGGYFIDLRQFYESSDETAYEKYYESMLNSASYSGTYKPLSESSDPKYGIYYCPRDYNKPAIVYNKTLMEEYNIEIPNTDEGWTMDEFFTFAQTVNDAINDKYYGGNRGAGSYRVINMNLYWEPVYTTLLYALGGESFISSSKTYNLTSDKNKAAIKKFVENMPGYRYDKNDNHNFMLDTDDNFNSGLTFMTIVSRPLVIGITNSLNAGNQSIDFLPFPSDRVASGNSGYGITYYAAENEISGPNGRKAKVKDLCWDFLKFVITEKGQEVAGETGLSIPVLKSLSENGSWTKWKEELNLNHKAWLQGGAIAQDAYTVFPTSKRTALRTLVSNSFHYIARSANSNEATYLKYLSDVKVDFDKQING